MLLCIKSELCMLVEICDPISYWDACLHAVPHSLESVLLSLGL